MKLTPLECESIAATIEAEGFDYYFTDYGADERLKKLIGLDIKNFQDAKNNLMNALRDIGLELE